MQVRGVVSERGLGAPDNDDCAGFAETPAGLCAWVIDGATNVAGADFLNAGRGDVAWYANALSRRLGANAAHGLALEDLHAKAAAEVAECYRDLLASLAAPPPRHAHPLAAVTIVRVAAGRVELHQLGDCPAFALGEDGAVRRLTFGKESDAATESPSPVKAAQAAVGYSAKAVWANLLPSLRREREALIDARPLQVSAPIAGAPFGGYSARFDLAGVAAIVLMSDGFERFAVKYELGDEATMIRRSVTEGPAPLLTAIRAVETADPDCRCFPRLKASDDATCLVLSVAARP